MLGSSVITQKQFKSEQESQNTSGIPYNAETVFHIDW